MISSAAELPESRLYTFIDEPREFALYFLEGQKLIHDLALLHPVRRDGFAYFRDVVLSFQPMIGLIKGGEQLGFYIDSQEPYFRIKIETGHHGATRCMILPEDFQEFPPAMRGLVRMLKVFPNNQPPYESVLQVDSLPLGEIVNRVLRDSYQMPCVGRVSQVSDQSLLLNRLPQLRGKDVSDYSLEAVEARWEQIREAIGAIFERHLHESESLKSAFAEVGFRLLSSRPVRFQCSCSRPRMIQNVHSVYKTEGESLFDPGQQILEVTCEYCKTQYEISRADLQLSDSRPN
jgi:molecular chaperone Hsp33